MQGGGEIRSKTDYGCPLWNVKWSIPIYPIQLRARRLLLCCFEFFFSGFCKGNWKYNDNSMARQQHPSIRLCWGKLCQIMQTQKWVKKQGGELGSMRMKNMKGFKRKTTQSSFWSNILQALIHFYLIKPIKYLCTRPNIFEINITFTSPISSPGIPQPNLNGTPIVPLVKDQLTFPGLYWSW